MNEQSPGEPNPDPNEAGDTARVEILDEIIDIEDYAAQGLHVPKARGYRIRVNRERLEIFEQDPTRETILTKAGLLPVDQWTLRLKLRGGGSELIKPGQRIDLCAHGIEKFKALPRGQTEG